MFILNDVHAHAFHPEPVSIIRQPANVDGRISAKKLRLTIAMSLLPLVAIVGAIGALALTIGH